MLFSIFNLEIVEGQANKLNDLQKQLQTLQAEIDQLEKKYNDAVSKLQNEVENLTTIEKQITLIQKKMAIFHNQIVGKNREISTLNTDISKLQRQLHKLKSIFANQILFAQKYKVGRYFEWILGSHSLNQALINQFYFKKTSEFERNTFEKIKSVSDEFRIISEKLINERKILGNILQSAESEQKLLLAKKSEKQKLIHTINNNKNKLSALMKEKTRSYKIILKHIGELEKNRSKRQLSGKINLKWKNLTGDFKKNKGRLNWPVNGTVLHKFGKSKNPKLKTILINTGIDIRTKRGVFVKNVYDGIVSLITYLSGFGNTVIIDHNDGYYSVYAHLDQILVDSGEFIAAGTPLGITGETGSLEGPKLHFEIYGQNKPENPLHWLRAK